MGGKYSDVVRRKVVQLDLNGSFIKEWNSIKEAQSEIKTNHISAVCRGHRNCAAGFKWKYIEDYYNFLGVKPEKKTRKKKGE